MIKQLIACGAFVNNKDIESLNQYFLSGDLERDLAVNRKQFDNPNQTKIVLGCVGLIGLSFWAELPTNSRLILW